MKRGSPLRRGTPLRAGTSQLKTSTPLRRTAMRPTRPGAATPAERLARRQVRARSGGRCELGWVCDGTATATDYAHRVARSQGGPWTAGNAADACRLCHQHAHAHPVQSRRRGWSVRRGHNYLTTPVAHAHLGWVLLADDGGHTPIERAAA